MQKDIKPYNILIIEDNLGDCVLIEEYLAENILQVNLQQAENFQVAKKLLLEAPNKYDIIFLDLSLPDLSGEQLIIQVVEVASKCPVIALTGLTDLDFSIRSLALGVSDYLLKDELTPIILYKSIIYSIQRSAFTKQLKNSEKRYSDLFQLSPLPMWVFDLETLVFLNVNKAAIALYGYSEAEFFSMNLAEIRPAEELAEMYEFIEMSRNGRPAPPRHVFRHKKKSGETITVETTSTRLFFNKKAAILVLINDITERTKYIETIEKQNKLFQEISWIQSHVVRAPLARLLGLVNLMETDLDSQNPELASLMTYIKESASELDQIIRDISKKSDTIERLDKNEH